MMIFSQPRSERIVSYDMAVKLDTENKIITGKMLLTWRNPSSDRISELQFHLYLNAFKNTRSTFMKESHGIHRGFRLNENRREDWGYIDITGMKVVDGEDLTQRIRFIQPDDGNTDDQTVCAVTLAEPLEANGVIQLAIDFTAKLPKIFARSGYSDDYFFVGQWFPKIGVYEPAGHRYAKSGQWNCHQYHLNSEFYANHGVYNVAITLPSRFIVGSGGVTESEYDNGDGSKTVTIRAEDIVDFAWTASPRFMVVADRWKHVGIKLYLQPEHFSQADRHLDAAKAAFDYFEEHLGEYPYPHLSIVDPPFRGLGSAGMEYTTLITAGCLWGMPKGMRLTEMVTIHELGHAYFMGILASNEFEEPWMDEGFNTYYESRIMDHTFGAKKSFVDFMGIKIGDGEMVRNGYVGMKNPKIAENYRNSWEFPHGGYGPLSYKKTATWLHTLAGLLGMDTMDEIMKTFYQKWQFKHPCAKDFIEIVNTVVTRKHGKKFGEDMGWFFDAVLYGSDSCDYKLASIRNEKVTSPRGLVDNNGRKELLTGGAAQGDRIESRVIVHRLGEICLPTEVLIRFDNGDEVLEHWGGRERSVEFSFRRPQKVVMAMVDPGHKIWMDVNLMNNSLRTKPVKTPVRKIGAYLLFILQNLLQSAAQMI